MSRAKIITVAGARPNFIKIAPLVSEFEKHADLDSILLHTGQHYDDAMSHSFFEDLGIPTPDHNLEVGSASHAVQTARVMERFEKVMLDEKPDLVIVVGDVNSTVACSLTSVKLGTPVAHVEAGLRSFDRGMPEEINRLMTDAISEYLFTTEESANENLRKEGVPEERIHFVGNVMIDTLLKQREKALQSDVLTRLGLTEDSFGLLTLHRPSNVDDRETLDRILSAIGHVAQELPILFPCHPRTLGKLKEFDLERHITSDDSAVQSGIRIVKPLGYLEFLNLMSTARLVLSDSGGIQEETTILGTACITLRENTERPVTVSQGTNFIAGTNPETIAQKAREAIAGKGVTGRTPEMWDGKASERITAVIRKELASRRG